MRKDIFESLYSRIERVVSWLLLRTVIQLCSNRIVGARRLNVLNYHRVVASHDPLQPDYVTVSQFEKEMRWLSVYCTVLPLKDAVELLKKNNLPPGAVAITFDDGYADNYLDALPLLQTYNLPATFFVTVDYLKNTPKWDVFVESIRGTSLISIDLNQVVYSLKKMEDKAYFFQQAVLYFKTLEHEDSGLELDALINKLGVSPSGTLMMDEEMLVALSRVSMVEIGAHGIYHQILSKVSTSEAHDEILSSKQCLEEIVKTDVLGQAFPNGVYPVDFDDEHIDMVRKAGFSYGVSTNLGSVGPKDDLFRMCRIGPWRRDKFGFVAGLAINYWRGQS